MRRRLSWSWWPPSVSAEEGSPPGASLGDRAAVALGLVMLGLFALSKRELPGESTHAFDLGAGVLLAAAVALLPLSRRFPATVAALEVGLSIVWYWRYTGRLIDVPTIVAFYMLGTTGDRRRQLGVGGITAVLLLVGVMDDPSNVDIAIEGVGWTVAAILCGELVRSRRLLLDTYAERAMRAEAERDAEAERQVASERLRIARDVHDVLAHTVSLMSVQAEVAADAVERGAGRPAVQSALATLRSAGKDAMAEVRATVAVLRGVGGKDLGTTPAPNLDRMDELVAAGRTQGLDVELTMDLEGVEVESLVELTAYRIVQEGLTNVARHSAASRAAVRIRGGPTGLVVEVVDDGRPTTPPSPGEPGWPTSPGTTATATAVTADPAAGAGFGLRGMSERVDAVGGAVSYGPMPGRGWAVRATLPTKEREGGR